MSKDELDSIAGAVDEIRQAQGKVCDGNGSRDTLGGGYTEKIDGPKEGSMRWSCEVSPWQRQRRLGDRSGVGGWEGWWRRGKELLGLHHDEGWKAVLGALWGARLGGRWGAPLGELLWTGHGVWLKPGLGVPAEQRRCQWGPDPGGHQWWSTASVKRSASSSASMRSTGGEQLSYKCPWGRNLSKC